MALKVFVGWDERDADAWRVCAHSLMRHSSIPLDVRPLVHWRLRQAGVFWRENYTEGNGQKSDIKDGRPFSTDFAFTRFLVPYLCDYADEKVVFVDADWLWRGDIAEMMEQCTGSKSLWCVKHRHEPSEDIKMGGLYQARYERKNWSSLMVMNPSKNRFLTLYAVNNATGRQLHQIHWLKENEIGSLGEEWNWLEGWSSVEIEPKAVHYTRGTPDLPGCENALYADEWRAELEMCGSVMCASPAS